MLTTTPVESTVLYNQGIFLPERTREIIRQIRSLLTQVVELDDATLARTGLGQFSLVTDFGKRVLPVPSADLDTTWEGPVHSFLTKNAQTRPDQPAISYNNQVVTYKQLGKLIPSKPCTGRRSQVFPSRRGA